MYNNYFYKKWDEWLTEGFAAPAATATLKKAPKTDTYPHRDLKFEEEVESQLHEIEDDPLLKKKEDEEIPVDTPLVTDQPIDSDVDIVPPTPTASTTEPAPKTYDPQKIQPGITQMIIQKGVDAATRSTPEEREMFKTQAKQDMEAELQKHGVQPKTTAAVDPTTPTESPAPESGRMVTVPVGQTTPGASSGGGLNQALASQGFDVQGYLDAMQARTDYGAEVSAAGLEALKQRGELAPIDVDAARAAATKTKPAGSEHTHDSGHVSATEVTGKAGELTKYTPAAGLNFRKGRYNYAAPRMHNYLNGLGPAFSGIPVGDLSLEGGKASSKHKSHRHGTDVDIGIPMIGGGWSIADREKGGWKFKNIKANQLDVDRTLGFLRHSFKNGAKQVFLDKRFFDPLKNHAQTLIDAGKMSKKEFKSVFKRTQHVAGHANHFHVRLRGGAHKPHKHKHDHEHKAAEPAKQYASNLYSKGKINKNYSKHFKKLSGNTIVGKHSTTNNNKYIIHSPGNIDWNKKVNYAFYYHGNHGSPMDFNSKMKKKLPPNTVFIAAHSGAKPGGTGPKAGFIDHALDTIAKTYNIRPGALRRNVGNLSAFGHSAGGGSMGKHLSNSPWLNRFKNIQFNDATYGWNSTKRLAQKLKNKNALHFVARKGRELDWAKKRHKAYAGSRFSKVKGSHGRAKYRFTEHLDANKNIYDSYEITLMEGWDIFLNEMAAKTAINLPENWFIEIVDDFPIIKAAIVQKDAQGNIDRVPGQSNPFSAVQATHSSSPLYRGMPCLGAFILQKSAAPIGYGPLLYDVVMELAGDRGLAPDRTIVSQSAYNIWNFYLKNRPDVSTKQLDDIDNPITPEPEDDCSMKNMVDYDEKSWIESPLSKVYYKPSKDTIKDLEALGKLIYANTTEAIKDEPTFVEPEPDVSDQAMSDIFDEYEAGILEESDFQKFKF